MFEGAQQILSLGHVIFSSGHTKKVGN